MKQRHFCLGFFRLRQTKEGVSDSFYPDLLQIISTLSLCIQDITNLVGMVPLGGSYFKLLLLI